MKQKNFQEAQELFRRGVTKSEIVRRLGVSRPTVIAWLGRKEYDDGRGWQEGVKRSHTSLEEERIVALKKKRIGEKKFFLGARYVQMDYVKQFPNDPVPSTWFVNEVSRRHGLQTHEPKKRKKGQNIVSRLKFPIRSIVRLGTIQQSSDFIGKKFITGRTEPVSIFSTAYYQWFSLYQIWRVSSETAESATGCLTRLWRTTPVPNVMRMDNGMTFRGTGSREAHVGRCVKFLLNLGIAPLFSSPYQSYTNPHVEGHNRTFTEKLWTKYHFTGDEDIDKECDRFNGESREYYEYASREKLKDPSLRFLLPEQEIRTDILCSTKGKNIFFIRFVERWNEREHLCGIVVLNRFVFIKESFLNQYVFVSLNLHTATLHVSSEHDGIATEILRTEFPYTV